MLWGIRDSRKHLHKGGDGTTHATWPDKSKLLAATAEQQLQSRHTDSVRSKSSPCFKFSPPVVASITLRGDSTIPQVLKLTRTKGTSFRELHIENGGTITPLSRRHSNTALYLEGVTSCPVRYRTCSATCLEVYKSATGSSSILNTTSRNHSHERSQHSTPAIYKSLY